jgi:mono/diheme cytochrome c family protein
MDRGGIRWLVVPLLCGMLAGCEAAGEAGPESEGTGEQIADASGVAAAAAVPSGVDADAVEKGRELFLPCAVCHGLNGRGNQLGPSLRDPEWIHITGTLEEIERVIRDGVASPEGYPVPMVPMGGGDFDDEELRAVASYVYAISHPVTSSP